ncbi:MAG: hypothetical protein JW867_03530 [Candidatus Omnitrophica bacterium]|nr:hypothetical protein [Candidatus Omnitrophota bacterium]
MPNNTHHEKNSSLSLRPYFLALMLMIFQYWECWWLFQINGNNLTALFISITFITLLVFFVLDLKFSPKKIKIQDAFVWAVISLWIISSSRSLICGYKMKAVSIPLGIVLIMLIACAYIISYKKNLIYPLMASMIFFIIFYSAKYIENNQFEVFFEPGMPFWLVNENSQRLLQGQWIYRYEDYSMLPYPLLLIFPYLPFKFFNMDLRWANVLATCITVFLAFYAGKYSRFKNYRLLILIFFLSPATIYSMLSTHIFFYCLLLAFFIITINKGKIAWQKTLLLFSCFIRPLSLSLVPAWLIYQLKPKRSSPFLGLKKFYLIMKPSLLDITLILITLSPVIVSAKCFFWNLLNHPYLDGLKSIKLSNFPQSSTQLSLSYLLPYWKNLYLVSLTQLLGLLGICYLFYKKNYLYRNPDKSLIFCYMLFISLGVQLYNYYWFPVMAMSLFSALTEEERKK